ncbi:MAG: sodium:solute symporter [Bacteroidia bacterium]|nr:sodium:solute symporter [Bacteroidia bacterium]
MHAFENPWLPVMVIAGYFLVLMGISWFKGRNADQAGYFIGNKSSAWYMVAFGMIGDSLSGVTFVSVPGQVGVQHFNYMQIVLGYVAGYVVIERILLPLYYRMNLTSIYAYLGERMGEVSRQTGSFYFLLSRTIGAAFRLFISAGVLQIFLFDNLGVPFWLSVSLIIILILAYTLRGGIKTLVWTDTFQSLFLLAGVVLTAAAIISELNWSFGQAVNQIYSSEYSTLFNWDVQSKYFFGKQFISGMFIAIAMTGLDQNMMQKNLSCRSLEEAQKNIRWFSLIVVLVNLVFVALGALMYLYASQQGIQPPSRTDDFLPLLTLEHLGNFAAVVFLLGIIAATFSSADSVLTTLTTSLYYDIFGLDRNQSLSEVRKRRYRNLIHAGFAVLLLGVILLFKAINNEAVINGIFTAAGYTYGPLLGLFAFGIFTKRQVRDKLTPLICVLAPLLCRLLSKYSSLLFGGYQMGFELLVINGLLTFAGLLLFSQAKRPALQYPPSK